MKTYFFKTVASVFLLCCLMTSCSVTSKTSKAAGGAITGNWKITSIQGQEMTGDFIPDITFDLKEKRTFGSTGCNRFGSGLKIENGNRLLMQNPFSTKMACPDNGVETLFLSNFNSIVSYKIVDNKIQFLDKDQKVIMKGIKQ